MGFDEVKMLVVAGSILVGMYLQQAVPSQRFKWVLIVEVRLCCIDNHCVVYNRFACFKHHEVCLTRQST